MITNALHQITDAISPRSPSSYLLANPYATPSAPLRTSGDSNEIRLAGRGQRLVAVIIDGIILTCILLIFALVGFFFNFQGSRFEQVANGFDNFIVPLDPLSTNLLNGMLYLQIILYLGVYTLVNGYFLAKRGQTIGKMILNISIRDRDTLEVPPLTRIILKRYLIIDAVQLINILLYFVVDVVDIFSIFRRDKRMIHDQLANTIVVQDPQ